MPTELDCPEDLCIVGLQVAALLLPLHMAVPPCTHTPPACSNSFYKDTAPIGLGPTLKASFKPNHLFKAWSTNTVTFWSTVLGVRSSTYEYGGHKSGWNLRLHKTYTWRFIAALSTAAKRRHKSNVPQLAEWVGPSVAIQWIIKGGNKKKESTELCYNMDKPWSERSQSQ